MDKYSDADDYFSQANYYEDEGALQASVIKYTRAIKMHPRSSRIYTDFAHLLFKMKKFEKADSVIHTAIAMDPYSSSPYFNWAYSLASRGIYDEAVKHYAKAAELSPNDEYIYINWGSALRRQQKYAQAMEKYHKVLELDPRSSDAYNNLGVLAFHMQKYEETISHCEKAISINPTCVESYFNWGLALYQLDSHDEAREMQIAAKDQMATLLDYHQFKENCDIRLTREINLLIKRLEVETVEENIRHLKKHIEGMRQILLVLNE